MAAVTTKKAGASTNRRRAGAAETPRPSVSFRLRADVYEKIKASAEARGFSLSEEIEHRLNRSLDTAGDHFAELALQLISDNWRAIQSLSGRKMVDDKFTLQACCEAAYRATELLAGVNGMDLKVGLFDSLGPEGINIEAAKQLGHAIVWHREVSAMKDPPEWAASVYQANVVDALAKRVAYLQARVGEATAAPAPSAPPAPQPQTPTSAGEPATMPEGTRWATPDELAGMVAVDDPKRPASLFDVHDFADLGMEQVGDPDDDVPPAAPAETPATRRKKTLLAVAHPEPEAVAPPAAPKRRGRAKAPAEG